MRFSTIFAFSLLAISYARPTPGSPSTNLVARDGPEKYPGNPGKHGGYGKGDHVTALCVSMVLQWLTALTGP
ncbi:hypothetical protein C8J56DRAFT_329927 [Mycena floridula]|nr:hypothetical protein C8J56DRAFT_329927 [Mycena floridula]